MTKRSDYISRDEYFMGVALLSAQRSKDPSTQVGACIVDTDKKIVGIGYNGFPRWCDDNDFPWWKSDNFLDNRNTYAVHSEANAILNAHNTNLRWCTLYVLMVPCNECAKLIIQTGISKVVYISDKNKHNEYFIASLKMLESAWVKLVKFDSPRSNITIDFDIYKENK